MLFKLLTNHYLKSYCLESHQFNFISINLWMIKLKTSLLKLIKTLKGFQKQDHAWLLWIEIWIAWLCFGLLMTKTKSCLASWQSLSFAWLSFYITQPFKIRKVMSWFLQSSRIRWIKMKLKRFYVGKDKLDKKDKVFKDYH